MNKSIELQEELKEAKEEKKMLFDEMIMSQEKADGIWESGDDGRDGLENQRDYLRQVGERDELHDDLSKSYLRNNEIKLSSGDRESESVRQ